MSTTNMAMDTFKFAVVAAALSEDVRQAPRFARGAGFAGLLFDVSSPGLYMPDLTLSGRREFKHMLTAQEQQLVGLRLDLGPAGISLGADIDRALANLDRAMEAAIGLGTRLLCVDLGPLPEPPRSRKPKPAIAPQQAGRIILPAEFLAAPAPQSTTLEALPSTVDPNFLAQVDAVLADLGRRADRYGVTLAFRSDLASFAALERAIKAANCPWFAIDLDPVAILRDEWSLDELFSTLGSFIRHVRARDAIRGTDRRTKPAPLGRGSTNWPQLLAALDDAAYQGWITLDSLELPHRTAAATEGLSHLRSASR